jgi:hypothetical protein
MIISVLKIFFLNATFLWRFSVDITTNVTYLITIILSAYSVSMFSDSLYNQPVISSFFRTHINKANDHCEMLPIIYKTMVISLNKLLGFFPQ